MAWLDGRDLSFLRLFSTPSRTRITSISSHDSALCIPMTMSSLSDGEQEPVEKIAGAIPRDWDGRGPALQTGSNYVANYADGRPKQ
jgi:hypothetical protein